MNEKLKWLSITMKVVTRIVSISAAGVGVSLLASGEYFGGFIAIVVSLTSFFISDMY